MGASTPRTDWIWKDGEMIPWDDARLHVMSHVVHYGSSVFEGIRFYETTEGPAIFRLTDHVRRFYESCRVYRMKPWVVAAELRLACAELVERNELESGYIRPISIRGVGALGVDPADSPVETYIVCWPWGEYLGAEALGSGVDACVSTWLRPAPNTHPALAKAGGNYLNGQLMKMEARLNGYAEAIALGDRGLVSEGSGQNIFLVRDGTVLTPRLDGTMLQGITRDWRDPAGPSARDSRPASRTCPESCSTRPTRSSSPVPLARSRRSAASTGFPWGWRGRTRDPDPSGRIPGRRGRHAARTASAGSSTSASRGRWPCERSVERRRTDRQDPAPAPE